MNDLQMLWFWITNVIAIYLVYMFLAERFISIFWYVCKYSLYTVDIKVYTPVKMSGFCDVKKTKLNHIRTFSSFNMTHKL